MTRLLTTLTLSVCLSFGVVTAVDFFSLCTYGSGIPYVREVSDFDKLELKISGSNWPLSETRCVLDIRSENGIDDLYYTFNSVRVGDYGTVVELNGLDFPFSSVVQIRKDQFYSSIGTRYLTESTLRITVTRANSYDTDLNVNLDVTTDDYIFTDLANAVGLGVGAIIGIVVGIIALIVIVVVVICCCVIKAATHHRTNHGAVIGTATPAGYPQVASVAYPAQPGYPPPMTHTTVATGGYPMYPKST